MRLQGPFQYCSKCRSNRPHFWIEEVTLECGTCKQTETVSKTAMARQAIIDRQPADMKAVKAEYPLTLKDVLNPEELKASFSSYPSEGSEIILVKNAPIADEEIQALSLNPKVQEVMDKFNTPPIEGPAIVSHRVIFIDSSENVNIMKIEAKPEDKPGIGGTTFKIIPKKKGWADGL